MCTISVVAIMNGMSRVVLQKLPALDKEVAAGSRLKYPGLLHPSYRGRENLVVVVVGYEEGAEGTCQLARCTRQTVGYTLPIITLRVCASLPDSNSALILTVKIDCLFVK